MSSLQILQPFHANAMRTKDLSDVFVNEIETPPPGESDQETLGNPDTLVVSPYVSREHLLQLSSVSMPNQLLARALTVLKAIRPDYSTAPYIGSFNWPVVIEKLRDLIRQEDFQWTKQDFYVVAFRSQIRPDTDRSHLGGLDSNSHAEAMQSGGLLKYWFGSPNEQGENLATCVWREQLDAKRGSCGPGHRQAARETRHLYIGWQIEQLRLTIGDSADNWDITAWNAEP